MDLKQLNTLVALVEHGFNVTETAESLFVVQSAVSQQMTRLEDELGVQIFVRKGKRLISLTQAGQSILENAREMAVLRENIQAVGEDHDRDERGVLKIGATHAQARYVLPHIIKRFREKFPEIRFQIQQGPPAELVELAVSGKVDMSICTERLGEHPSLTSFNCYRWNRCLVAPEDHPVFESRPLSMESICEYPLITYTFGFTGAGHIQSILSRAGLTPEVVLTAVDTDVIKTYVREGLGIGIIANMAYSDELDTDLRAYDLSNLLPWETTQVAYHRDKYLKRYQMYLIELLTTMILDNGAIIVNE